MDNIDRKILNILQKEFPLIERPFLEVAQKCGLNEEEVISRVQKLKEQGIIRRIGAIFDGAKLGRTSTLCGVKVPDEELEGFIKVLNSNAGVTHSYRRNNEYNVWFTLNAESEVDIEYILAQLRAETGNEDILSMKAVRTFKINATFEL
ncbi:MAG: AsnC family transcriptional regulator [Smithella sp.]